MSSISSPVSSQSGGSSATTYFTGMSNYSQDLNNAISRAVQIAGLPIQLLQNHVNDLTNQQDELETLNGDVASIQSAVATLASAAGSMLTASVSDPSVATATVGSTATAGSYSLAVANLGSYSDALSIDGLAAVTDPSKQNISASGSYTLTVTIGAGAPATTPISFSGGNLNVLAQAINESGAGVQATVVDVGSSSAPDYRLSLQSDQLGPVTMQLNDGSRNLLAASGAAGVPAQYSINGKQVESGSDTVTLAPGLTVQLTGESDGAATVTVAADPTGLGTALQSLVTAYNSAIAELNNNRGQTDVALAGQSIVYQLTNALQGLASYATGAGGIASLAALGVNFDDTTGKLSFDQSAFDAATSGQTGALTQFLGSAAGGGFLQTATNTMTELLDPTDGVLTQQIHSVQANLTRTNSQIADKEAQVTQLQNNLTQQMAAADTMIYDLQQQATEIQDMFTAEQDSELGIANGL
jgi:flagellar hook-associated protein 2